MNDMPMSLKFCTRGTSIASSMQTCSPSLQEVQFFSITMATREVCGRP